MPPVYKFRLGQHVRIVAQQSTGIVFATGRNPREGINRYTVKIDANQPLVTTDGLYTCFESELEALVGDQR